LELIFKSSKFTSYLATGL